MSAFTHDPQEGSPFESEKQRLPQSARVRAGTILVHAQMVCQFRLLAALDFMSGIASLMETAKSVYSVFPLSRAVIENAAFVSWILEPGISAGQRAYRGALDHQASTRESLNNLRKLRQSDPEEEQSLHLTERIAQYESNLDDIGRDLSLVRESLPSNTDERHPSKRQVVDDAVTAHSSRVGVGKIQYGYLSDVTHGGVASLLNHHHGDGMMAEFNVRVDRFMLPAEIAFTTMQLCLARVATFWSLKPVDKELHQVLDAFETSIRDHGSEPAFHRVSNGNTNVAEPASEG